MEPFAAGAGADGLSAEAVKRARRGRRLLTVAVVIAVAGVAFFARSAVKKRRRRAALDEVSQALSVYSECMLGVPLAPGETATKRLRRIEAGLPEVSANANGPSVSPEQAWPVRCKGQLDRAHASLEGDSTLSREPLAEQLDELVLRARLDPNPTDAPDLVDSLLGAARRAGVAVSPRRYPPPGSPVAPPPASPLGAAALAPLPVRVRSAADEIQATDPLTLRLSFFDPKEGPWICNFTASHGDPLRRAQCAETRPGATSSRGDDEKRGPGILRTERGRFDRFELVRAVPGGPPDITTMPLSAETVALYGDQLVWVTAHRWYARNVTAGRAPLGPAVDLGDVVGSAPELEACQTATSLLVGVKTRDETLPDHKSWHSMAARDRGDAEWKRTPGRSVVDVGATLTCQGHAGTWTWFDRPVVSQVRCNVDRCETRASERLTLSWDVGGALYAADLGGRALLLGLGTTPGPLTGKSVTSVRMRMAPLAAITKAPDVVLFSDEAHDGARVSDVSVFARDGAALVLLRGGDSLPYRAIRLDALGNFEPVTVAE